MLGEKYGKSLLMAVVRSTNLATRACFVRQTSHVSNRMRISSNKAFMALYHQAPLMKVDVLHWLTTDICCSYYKFAYYAM